MNNNNAVVPIDTMSLSTKARRRMRTSREEIAVLEDFYSKNPNPTQANKEEIASVVQMGVRNVHFWFQNRRAKDNKKKKLIKAKQELGHHQQHSKHLSPTVTDNNAFYHQSTSAQPQFKGNGKFNLPPISTIMVPNFHNFSIPFYFHHSKFGIEDCMLQWWSDVNDGGATTSALNKY